MTSTGKLALTLAALFGVIASVTACLAPGIPRVAWMLGVAAALLLAYAVTQIRKTTIARRLRFWPMARNAIIYRALLLMSLELLDAVEWTCEDPDSATSELFCPSCNASLVDGHDKGCALALLRDRIRRALS